MNIPHASYPPPATSTRPERRGFTLIELLTVIAIIGILAAIIIPTVSKVRASAQKATCVSNLRQIGSGMLLYANDNKGCLPPAQNPALGGQLGYWGYSIWTYVGYQKAAFVYPSNDLQNGDPNGLGYDQNIFHCPITRSIEMVIVPTAPQTPTNTNRVSYMMNSDPLYSTALGGPTGSPATSLSLAKVSQPSRTAMIHESYGGLYGGSYAYLYTSGLMPHGGASNFLFMDAHVATMRPNDVPKAWWEAPAGKTFWQGL